MDRLGENCLIKILAEIHTAGCINEITNLAKKLLPQEDCTLIWGNFLHLEAVLAVYRAKKIYHDITKVEQICSMCALGFTCPFPRRN